MHIKFSGKLEEYPIAECHSGVNKHVNRTYDGKTPINELPAKVLKVYKGLDYGGINDWHCFAAEMDCKYSFFFSFFFFYFSRNYIMI